MKNKLIMFLALVLVMTTCFSTYSTTAAATVWFTKNLNPPDDDYAYSFAIVGDTQILCSADAGTHAFLPTNQNYMKNIYGWIVNNKDTKKIAHVFGMGDITQNNDTTKGGKEWPVAMAAINQLNGVIPYSMIRGNHDHKTLYDNNFNTTTYKSQFAGSYNNGARNTYRFMDIAGEHYLFMTLDYCPSNEVITWANNVLSNPNYANCKVIISTHGYMDGTGYRMSAGTDYMWNADCSCANGCSCGKTNYGQQIWDKLAKKYSNVFMVLCGHMGCPGTIITTDVGDNGNTVYQVLVNPQDIDGGGDGNTDPTLADPIGAVALLCFSKDGSTFWVEYYSTVKQKYYAQPVSKIVYSAPRFETQIATKTTASVRISSTQTGLRFKTDINKSYLEELKTTYGAANVSVGTLIAPADILKNNELTHSFGTAGSDYVDIPATLDNPFSSDSTTNTYAGSLVSIKDANLTRDFVGVGYIKITQSGKSPTYIYSDSYSTRNVSRVAYAAYSDVSSSLGNEYVNLIESNDSFNGTYSPYPAYQRNILASLVKNQYINDSYDFDIFDKSNKNDPFGDDYF